MQKKQILPVCFFHAKKINIKTTIGNGIQLNRVSNPSKVASMGALTS